MKLILERNWNKEKYTIGKLYYIDETTKGKKYICDTLEDTDRRLTDNMEVEAIKQLKVYAKTAIPTGCYQITLNTVSPKYVKKKYYKQFCGGRVPRLLGVKGFEGILIHIGNDADDSAGCILVGYNKEVGKVLQSTKAFEKLYKILLSAKYGTQIEVKRNY
jgi:hypothetical protein